MNPIIQSIKTRRSVRKFCDKPVPHELIEQVIEAGRFAASGHDRQPWAIICVEDEQTRRRLSAVNATFFDLPVKDPFYGAPVYIIVLTKKSTPTYVYDGSQALATMMLAAHSLGLATCWIHRARQVFELSGNAGDRASYARAILKQSGVEAEPRHASDWWLDYPDEIHTRVFFILDTYRRRLVHRRQTLTSERVPVRYHYGRTWK